MSLVLLLAVIGATPQTQQEPHQVSMFDDRTCFEISVDLMLDQIEASQARRVTLVQKMPQVIQVPGAQLRTSSYPTHGISWHIVGSAETKQELIDHMMTHPEHRNVRARFSRADLQLMTRAQLLTLHDDSHNRRIAGSAQVVTSAQPARAVSRYSAAQTFSSGCPGGVCPTNISRGRRR